MDVSETDKANNIGSSPVNATLGSCSACPINENNITASFDDPECRTDVVWPEPTSAPADLLTNFCDNNSDFECYKEGFPQCCLTQDCVPNKSKPSCNTVATGLCQSVIARHGNLK